MSAIGVVCEFNPFHLGHFEHLRQSLEAVETDAPVVCVMSGDFVQRGAPAIFNKHVRAEAAILSGADIVFELPLPWCIASAEKFATGAVGLLNSLGVITHLSFGSESGALAPLTTLALAAGEPETVEKIKDRMTQGISFAAAREMVLHETLGEESRLLQTPNNILAVEYLKALFSLGSPMIPVTTLRDGVQHDSMADGAVRSAGRLRSMMEAGEDISAYLPAESRDIPKREAALGHGPVTMEKLETAAMSRLRLMTEEQVCSLPDATEGLGNRVYKAIRSECSVEAVLSAVKTKRYPLSRLRRILLCGMLGVTADTGGQIPPYARLLASTEKGRALLRTMVTKSAVPIVNKPAGAKQLHGEAEKIFTLTANARDFYVLGYEAVSERKGGSDWRTSPVTL